VTTKTFYLAKSSLCQGLYLFATEPEPVPKWNAIKQKIEIMFYNCFNTKRLAHIYNLEILFPELASMKEGQVKKLELISENGEHKITLL